MNLNEVLLKTKSDCDKTFLNGRLSFFWELPKIFAAIVLMDARVGEKNAAAGSNLPLRVKNADIDDWSHEHNEAFDN